MEAPLFNTDQEDAIKELMHHALDDYFSSKGKLTKQIIVATAVLIGSLTVIVGGFKIVLGWLGFVMLMK